MVLEQFAGMAGVFGSNPVDLTKQPDGPVADILEITDWCRYDIQDAGHLFHRQNVAAYTVENTVGQNVLEGAVFQSLLFGAVADKGGFNQDTRH